MGPWTEIPDEEYGAIWDRFDAAFQFAPDYSERTKPAISEPAPFVTFDLSADLTDEALDDIDRTFLDAFRATTPADRTLLFLDWQHTSYRFDPHAANRVSWWYPDGDYYIFLAEDFSFGTFGHPWQQSICVFGSELLNVAERRLREQLAVLREATG